MTLPHEITLSSGRSADVPLCLKEIEAADSKDPAPQSAVFEPTTSVTLATAWTAKQNGSLAVLKAKRLEVARAQKQPAFVIFPDGVLIEMALRRPQTSEELLQIPGVGQAKAARYGAIFLAVIANHSSNS
jgi:ATP-dependent DNA helicase RecQ